MRQLIVSAFVTAVFITGCSDYSADLPGGYYLASEAKDHQVIVNQNWKAGDPYISCNVEAYNADDRYIVAIQRVTPTCFWSTESSMLEFSGKRLFWIIDSKEQKILGPYNNEKTYEAKRMEYGVIASLE